MNLNQYQPLNTKELINKLIDDLRNGKLKYTSSQQAEIDCLCEIRKIKLQLYFKERFTELQEVETPKLQIEKRHKNVIPPKQPKEHKTENSKLINKATSKKTKYLERFYDKEIKLVAEILNISPDYLLRLLEQKQIYKKPEDKLSDREVEVIGEFILSRKKALHRKHKEEVVLKRSIENPSASDLKKAKMGRSGGTSKSESVFDKASKYGVGKIIYIRSK